MKIIIALSLAVIFSAGGYGLSLINNVLWSDNSQEKIKHLTNMAESGDMKAQTDLGFAYGNGDGVEKNNLKAVY